MNNERISGAHHVRRGVPVTGAPLLAAALVCGGGQAVVQASAGPPAPAAGRAAVISAIAGGRLHHQAMTAGDIYTIAGGGPGGLGDGGPAADSQLSAPADIALDSQGNLVIADTGHGRVRMVAAATGTLYGQAMTAGDIYTIAGRGGAGFSGDGGPAVKARLHRPTGVALDATGNVLISDSYNQRIRVLAAATGTFYGQAMTAGDIYTIAGTGKAFPANRVPAAKAGFSGFGLAVTAAGNLQVSDLPANRILEIGG